MRTRWSQSDKQDSDSSRARMRARWMTGAEGFGEHCREERTSKEIQQNLIVHLTLPSRNTHLANKNILTKLFQIFVDFASFVQSLASTP